MLIATKPAPSRPHPLMKRSELARAFRVDPTTIDNWRRAGELAGCVVELPNDRFLYSRAALSEKWPQIFGTP